MVEFRGKMVDTNKWVYGSLIKDGDKFLIYVDEDDKENHGLVEVEYSTIGEETGWCDEYGNPLYEGDILIKYGGCSYVMHYGDNGNWQLTGENGDVIEFDDYNEEDFMLVSNYHDEPELYTPKNFSVN